MTSMAAALAASLPAPVLPTVAPQPQVTKVPQRLEGVVDPEALRDVESVKLNALVSYTLVYVGATDRRLTRARCL